MICKNCGKENPQESKFCSNCGAKMEDETFSYERPLSGIELLQRMQGNQTQSDVVMHPNAMAQQNKMPMQQSTVPAQQSTVPVQQSTVTVQQNQKPVQQNQEPMQQSTVPVQQSQTPTQQSQKPVQQNQSPFQNQAPVQNQALVSNQMSEQQWNINSNVIPQSNATRKKNVVPIVIAVIVAVVLVVGIILAAIATFAIKSYKDSDKKQQETNSQYETETETDAEPVTEDAKQAVSDEEIEKTDLSLEQRSALLELSTDYGKINWIKAYTLEDNPDLVITVAPYEIAGVKKLLVGVTNIGTKQYMYSAMGDLLDDQGNPIGKAFVDGTAIAVGNTEIFFMGADNNVDVCEDIRWTNFAVDDASDFEIGAWEADYAVAGADGVININIMMKNVCLKSQVTGTVGVVLIDEFGNIIGVNSSYQSDEIEPNEQQKIEIELEIDKENYSKVKDLALFANPICY